MAKALRPVSDALMDRADLLRVTMVSSSAQDEQTPDASRSGFDGAWGWASASVPQAASALQAVASGPTGFSVESCATAAAPAGAAEPGLSPRSSLDQLAKAVAGLAAKSLRSSRAATSIAPLPHPSGSDVRVRVEAPLHRDGWAQVTVPHVMDGRIAFVLSLRWVTAWADSARSSVRRATAGGR
ncbi:hypothetical protein FNF27_01831 [Cafeteria roenbergensis]|uniref:Uncharacterized protein n=1 Tax=Cafeteria roenbergensis TaxID=33653 RepID=A0A5A8EKU1_CAFRO|nr:hypothetical protein FNF27_01831 [Cafeteria roenbergensis]